MDRQLIGLLVEREIESRTTWAHFASQSGVSRATLYRVKEGDPRVTHGILRRIERALDLPFDSLSAVGIHDWDTLSRQGINGELIKWLQERATSSHVSDVSTSTKRSRPASAPGNV